MGRRLKRLPTERERLQQSVCCELLALEDLPPLDPELSPTARGIIARVVAEFARDFPDGLPSAGTEPVVAAYQQRAAKLYDDAMAQQRELEAFW